MSATLRRKSIELEIFTFVGSSLCLRSTSYFGQCHSISNTDMLCSVLETIKLIGSFLVDFFRNHSFVKSFIIIGILYCMWDVVWIESTSQELIGLDKDLYILRVMCAFSCKYR